MAASAGDETAQRELIAEFSGNRWFDACEVNLSELFDRWGTPACTVLSGLTGYAGEPLLAGVLALRPLTVVCNHVINFIMGNSAGAGNKPTPGF